MNEQELVGASHPEVHRLLGVADCVDPPQIVRRLLTLGVPHLRLSARRIRFHLPTLREWVAEQTAPRNGKTPNQWFRISHASPQFSLKKISDLARDKEKAGRLWPPAEVVGYLG